MSRRYTTQEAAKMARLLGLPADDDIIEQLRAGMEVEHEHDDLIGGSAMKSAQIAAAHLREDPLYYLPLLALERFRDGQRQAPTVQVRAISQGGSPVIAIGVEGVPLPLMSDEFLDAGEARAVAAFLRAHPTLAIVYAWMLLRQ